MALEDFKWYHSSCHLWFLAGAPYYELVREREGAPSVIPRCSRLFPFIFPSFFVARLKLDTGETEVLITSLIDKKVLPCDLFRELYHLRWPVEEDYKKMKSWIEIENFSGKSVESVHQDFYAKVFAKNLTAVIASTTSENIDAAYKTRKYLYQVNYAQAYSEMKRIIPTLFFRSKDLVSEIIAALREFLVQTVEPIRPGRKFQRKKMPPRNFYQNYKAIC